MLWSDVKRYGKTRRGKAQCSTKPRKNGPDGKPRVTKAERRLQRRIESFNAAARVLGITNPRADGFHRPGSLQLS